MEWRHRGGKRHQAAGPALLRERKTGRLYVSTRSAKFKVSHVACGAEEMVREESRATSGLSAKAPWPHSSSKQNLWSQSRTFHQSKSDTWSLGRELVE
jgi:hypothetical protein